MVIIQSTGGPHSVQSHRKFPKERDQNTRCSTNLAHLDSVLLKKLLDMHSFLHSQ